MMDVVGSVGLMLVEWIGLLVAGLAIVATLGVLQIVTLKSCAKRSKRRG